MEDVVGSPQMTGLELRYLLTTALLGRGTPTRLTELIDYLTDLGLDVHGRPSKTVSDALRWEMRKGRVVRLRRGLYAPGSMPRSTEWWIRKRAAAALDRVVAQTLADRALDV